MQHNAWPVHIGRWRGAGMGAGAPAPGLPHRVGKHGRQRVALLAQADPSGGRNTAQK